MTQLFGGTMSHQLEPHCDDPYLEPDEVAYRLREEFAYCEIDAEQGQKNVGAKLAKLIEFNEPRSLIAEVTAGQDSVLRIAIVDGDSIDNTLRFFVRQNAGLLISYASSRHEATASSLKELCATALGYDMKLL